MQNNKRAIDELLPFMRSLCDAPGAPLRKQIAAAMGLTYAGLDHLLKARRGVTLEHADSFARALGRRLVVMMPLEEHADRVERMAQGLVELDAATADELARLASMWPHLSVEQRTAMLTLAEPAAVRKRNG